MIASLAGVDVALRAFLGQFSALADDGVQVDGQLVISRPGTSVPSLGQQFPAHPIQLADVPPAEAGQKAPSVDGALTTQPSARSVLPARGTSAS